MYACNLNNILNLFFCQSCRYKNIIFSIFNFLLFLSYNEYGDPYSMVWKLDKPEIHTM